MQVLSSEQLPLFEQSSGQTPTVVRYSATITFCIASSSGCWLPTLSAARVKNLYWEPGSSGSTIRSALDLRTNGWIVPMSIVYII